MPDLTTLAKVKAWLDMGQVAETFVIPHAPGPYVVTVAKAAAWNGDAGVLQTVLGNYLTPAAEDPGPGEYTAAAGIYTFNAAQAGLAVSIAYSTILPADALLARRLSAASSWAQNYMDRDILSQAYVEIRDGQGGQRLFLRQYPVTAVALLLVNGQEIPPAPAGDFATSGYRFTDNLLILQGQQFGRGFGNVEIHYTAGWAAVPPELEQAIIELVAFSFKERGHIGQQSANFQGQTITFTVTDLPATVKSVLDHFRRVVPV